MQLDITTLIAIGSFIVAIGTLIWRSGGETAARKAFETYQAKSDADRQKWREDFEKSVEQRFAAASGATTLAREQIAELRERLAANYMTKTEIAEIERRLNNNTDRVLDHLDKIDARINVLTERVMEAIQNNKVKS